MSAVLPVHRSNSPVCLPKQWRRKNHGIPSNRQECSSLFARSHSKLKKWILFYLCSRTGVTVMDSQGNEYVISCGFIDTITKYTTYRAAETVYKLFTRFAATVIPPSLYAQRLRRFLDDIFKQEVDATTSPKSTNWRRPGKHWNSSTAIDKLFLITSLLQNIHFLHRLFINRHRGESREHYFFLSIVPCIGIWAGH